MNTLVMYDSAYGNTAKVAEAIAEALGTYGTVRSLVVGDVQPEDIARADYVFVGSPTQGGQATKPMNEFIAGLSKNSIDQTKFAVFDTRLVAKEQNKALQLLMKVIGYAAPKMAASLKKKGGNVIAEPEGFIVNDKEGPIREGELARAGEWAASLVKI